MKLALCLHVAIMVHLMIMFFAQYHTSVDQHGSKMESGTVTISVICRNLGKLVQ